MFQKIRPRALHSLLKCGDFPHRLATGRGRFPEPPVLVWLQKGLGVAIGRAEGLPAAATPCRLLGGQPRDGDPRPTLK